MFLKNRGSKILSPGYYWLDAGEKILSDEKLSRYINQIYDLSGEAPQDFDKTYQVTLKRLAEHCQSMSLSQEHEKPYGLLKESMLAGIVALKNRRCAFHKKESVWAYALFVHALIERFLHSVLDRELVFYNEAGDVLAESCPFLLNRYHPRCYYHCTFLSKPMDLENASFLPALLTQLVPREQVKGLYEFKSKAKPDKGAAEKILTVNQRNSFIHRVRGGIFIHCSGALAKPQKYYWGSWKEREVLSGLLIEEKHIKGPILENEINQHLQVEPII